MIYMSICACCNRWFESIGTLRGFEGAVVQVERRRRELELQLQTGCKHVESCENLLEAR